MKLFYVFRYTSKDTPPKEYTCAYIVAENAVKAREIAAKFTNDDTWLKRNIFGVSEIDMKTPRIVTTHQKGE